MTPTERQQSLENARRAYFFLKNYIESQIETPRLREEIACLLDEFDRLDKKEQKQIRAGSKGKKYGVLGASHGAKGGRPRKNGGKK